MVKPMGKSCRTLFPMKLNMNRAIAPIRAYPIPPKTPYFTIDSGEDNIVVPVTQRARREMIPNPIPI
jgi:hypothetical protein